MKTAHPVNLAPRAGLLLFVTLLFLLWPQPSPADTLVIGGPDAPGNGSIYSAAGGCPPYSWSISKGTISSDGVVIVAGQCGKATVTVTDSCGGTAAKTVKMPGGKWVTVSSGCSPDSNPHGAYCDIYSCYDSPDLDPSPVILRYRSKQPAWICPNCCRWLLRETIREWRCSSESQCLDQDRDGVYAKATNCASGSDCNDNDAATYPGAPELCDGKDNDCDTQTDDGLSWDTDGDGHFTVDSCLAPQDDCRDSDAATYPGATELCGDNIDNDCDGQTDEDCAVTVTITNVTVRQNADGTVTITVTWTVDGVATGQTLTIAGQSISLEANQRSVSWTGNLGPDLPEGAVVVSLAVDGASGGDVDSVEVNIAEAVTGCILQRSQEFGSRADLVDGELTETIPLFSVPGIGPFELRYHGFDGTDGPLGMNWTHPFNIVLNEDDLGTVAVRGRDGDWTLFTPTGTGYASRPGDTAILTRAADGTFVLTHKDGTRYAFGANSKIAAIIDRNGNALTFAYSSDALASVTDNTGRAVTFGYANGKLTSITDPAGNVYQVSVGTTLDGITLPDGASWQFSYQDNVFLAAKIDPAGHLTTYIYDDQQRVVGSTDPEGRGRAIAYPAETDMIRTTIFTEKDGSNWLYTYDVQTGDLVTKTDPKGNVTSYVYDADHNLISKTEPGSGTTAYSYDAAGNLLATTDPAGNTTTYTYNAFGQVTSVSEGEATTAYTYDEQGNLTKVTAPDGAVTTYQYDQQGRLINLTTATGEITALSYDARDNVAGVTGPDGKTTTFAYDANGRRTATTDADGHVTRYVYDVRGRLVTVIDAQGNITRFEYDANGNRTKVLDANGHATTFAYNFAGQMVSMTDALGYTTTFAYGGSAGCSSCGGGVDKLTSLTDAKGQATLFQYDPLGRLIQETDPLNHVTTYGYDAAGRVASKTDPNGQTIQYGYDTLGRLISKTYPDGTQTTFGYDAKGNLLSAANVSIAYTFGYDAGDRLAVVTDSFGAQINYAYDAAGKRTQMTSSTDIAIGYAYDDAGRLAQISSPAGNFMLGYDDLGRRSRLSFPNGVATTYTYDDLGRLTDLVSAKGNSVITENHYTHDAVGNRLSNRDARTTASYGYDASYRLTEAVSNAPGHSGNTTNSGKGTANATQNQKEIYIYDPVGNRLQTDKVQSYSHNAGNELLTAADTTYSYDANGNRTQKITASGTTAYAWDAENRLAQITLPDGKSVTYAYDPFGRRIAKTADGITTRYTYDGEDILFETVDGTMSNVYIHGSGIDEPLALLDSKGPSYYHADGLSSIVALTDSKAKVVQRYEYDSFGNRKDMQNTIKQPYTYTGREHDRETGLYYYRARYYDAMEGKFISKDPIGFAGGDVNLYNYVGGNPINYLDPSGLQDNWYGYNNINFQDWVHSEKQYFDYPGNKNYTKEELKGLFKEWEELGRPRGKGGKSGKGGQTRGLKGKCLGALAEFGLLLDSVDLLNQLKECEENPYMCSDDQL